LICVELLGELGDADGADEVLEELPVADLELLDVTLADRVELLFADDVDEILEGLPDVTLAGRVELLD
jgi:hypothetical protein